jgi:hypothetical protein
VSGRRMTPAPAARPSHGVPLGLVLLGILLAQAVAAFLFLWVFCPTVLSSLAR